MGTCFLLVSREGRAVAMDCRVPLLGFCGFPVLLPLPTRGQSNLRLSSRIYLGPGQGRGAKKLAWLTTRLQHKNFPQRLTAQ